VAAQRSQRLSGAHPLPYVTQQLQGSTAPVIAVSDYIRTLPESIRAFVPARYVTLGTDGFGRSDTRVNLRDFFEIDARWIAYTALCEVWGEDRARLEDAARTLGIDTTKPLSSTV
jgi:pyruvate dehydrogenase E1 component